MKYAEAEIRTDWRGRWPSYLATAGLLAGLGLVMIFLVTMSLRPKPAKTAPAPGPAPAGFTQDWTCNSTPRPDGAQVCWRNLPPAGLRSPAPIPQAHTRP